ncbi:MAG: response regulator [Chloroflexi bacterium]|nr:response regulator [Chloroflexota bacterium]
MTPPGALAGPDADGRPRASRPAEVLVVARPALVRFLAVKALERQGYRTLEVDDPAAAVAYARARPAGVLLDLAQAEGVGLDALRAIRAGDPAARVAVLTARADRALVLTALQAGACDLVVKPVPLARMARLMHARGRGPAGRDRGRSRTDGALHHRGHQPERLPVPLVARPYPQM